MHFCEANLVLGPPPGYGGDVVPLPVLRTIAGQLVSCWQLTPEEKEIIARTGKVWLSVWGGTSQPPVCVAAELEQLVA
jgi:hypothetical protein